MSALPDEPTHFLDWLKARDPAVTAGTFAPRLVYGNYLEDLLQSSVRDSRVQIELVQDEVVDLRLGSAWGRALVTTSAGRLVVADRVVLAVGNQPPHNPAGVQQLNSVRSYTADPWGPGVLDDMDALEPIALVGSGLTAVDVVVEASSHGHRGTIHAVSRHGLLPCRHRPAPPRPHFELGGKPLTARTLLHTVRTEAARCQVEGGDWRSVVDGIRPIAQSLWRSLDRPERQRFVRHVASHWDVHRHRVAPEIDDLLQRRIREGTLVVIAGRLVSLSERGGRVAVTFQRRGESHNETITVGRVINCTGPARDIRLSASKLMQSMLANGISRPGPLALGLDVSDHGALISRDGHAQDWLYAIGPLLKDHLWETTAVRELRTQAAELARRLLEHDR
jgi:uncharacterized NAD(P)/FAD-binding protein YdhS